MSDDSESTSTRTFDLDVALDLLGRFRSEIVWVEFIKRTNGERRQMRVDLTRDGEFTFDPLDKDLVPAYDLEADGWRMINARAVCRIETWDDIFTPVPSPDDEPDGDPSDLFQNQ